MGVVLIYAAEILAAVFVMRLIIEQGEFITGWIFEHVWRSIEIASGGRLKAGIGKTAGRYVAGKIKGWAGFAIMTVADPFIEIARSFMPRYELVPVVAEAQAAPTVPVDTASPAPGIPAAPAAPVASAPPPEPTADEKRKADYLTAIGFFKLRPDCSQNAAAKVWAKRSRDADADQVNAAWAVICDFRTWRVD